MKTKAKFSPEHYLNQLISHIEALEKQKKKVRKQSRPIAHSSGCFLLSPCSDLLGSLPLVEGQEPEDSAGRGGRRLYPSWH
jgi:hypothetical protein